MARGAWGVAGGAAGVDDRDLADYLAALLLAGGADLLRLLLAGGLHAAVDGLFVGLRQVGPLDAQVDDLHA